MNQVYFNVSDRSKSDTYTDRQTARLTDRQSDRQAHRQIERQRVIQAGRQTE